MAAKKKKPGVAKPKAPAKGSRTKPAAPPRTSVPIAGSAAVRGGKKKK